MGSEFLCNSQDVKGVQEVEAGVVGEKRASGNWPVCAWAMMNSKLTTDGNDEGIEIELAWFV